MLPTFLKKVSGASASGSPLRAAELHRLALRELGAGLHALGFERTPRSSVASWTRPANDRWIVMWLQPSQTSDRFSPGFKFTIEFALSTEPVIGGSGYRERLPNLLDDEAREELRRLENTTIAHLPPPARGLYAGFPDETRERLLAEWQPRKTPYPRGEDIWFRHANEEDARKLMAFFQRVLPSAIARFLESASSAS